MKFNNTITIRLSMEETSAWTTLYLAVADLAHKPCEDTEVAEAVNNLYEAMMNFTDYLDD